MLLREKKHIKEKKKSLFDQGLIEHPLNLLDAENPNFVNSGRELKPCRAENFKFAKNEQELAINSVP